MPTESFDKDFVLGPKGMANLEKELELELQKELELALQEKLEDHAVISELA